MIFHAAGWTCSLFTSFCLESCIWPDAILQWTDSERASDFVQIWHTGSDYTSIRRRRHELYMRVERESPNSPRLKEAKRKFSFPNFLWHQKDWSQKILASW
jgi:hypothetical protein